MRRLRLIAAFTFCLVSLGMILLNPMVQAYLPANIENAVKSWFSSASKLVKLRFFPSNASSPPNDTCDLYMDRSTMSLMAACDGQAATTVASASSLGCVHDGSGNLTCNTFSSLDQNALTPAALNRFRIMDNDVDLTPNPSCTDYGQTGILTLLDKDESVTDNYVLCDGQTELWSLSYAGNAARIVPAFGWGHGGSNTAALTDDQCACRLFTLDHAILDLDTIAVIVTAADSDANEATAIGVYSFDGLTQYFTGTLTDTATATVNVTNGTASPGIMYPGQYWFCTAYNQTVNTELRLRAVNGDATRTATFNQTCAGGTLPATLTSAAITFASAILPHVVLTDD